MQQLPQTRKREALSELFSSQSKGSRRGRVNDEQHGDTRLNQLPRFRTFPAPTHRCQRSYAFCDAHVVDPGVSRSSSFAESAVTSVCSSECVGAHKLATNLRFALITRFNSCLTAWFARHGLGTICQQSACLVPDCIQEQ